MEGRLLSASRLAELVGTSKSRILAYEKGTSVPDPSRVLALAKVFGVPTRELYKPIKGPTSLRDMREFACLTAAQVASYIKVSRATYRELEQSAIVPPRHASTLLAGLSAVLDLPSGMVERALESHPAVQGRRQAIADLLAVLFDRAHIRDTPAAVSPEEEAVVVLAELLRRPPGVTCRLVNNEMNRLRRMLLNHAIQSHAAAYAQTPAAKVQAEVQMDHVGNVIARFPKSAATVLDRFTSWALTGNEWRVLVQLHETTYIHVSDEALFDPSEHSLWLGLQAREFVVPDRDRLGVSKTYVLSVKGLREIQNNADRYGCLYPRVPAPRARSEAYRVARARPDNVLRQN